VIGAHTPLNLYLRLFRSGWRPNWPLLVGIMVVAALQAAAVAICSRIDGTWHIPDGKGFAEHYGIWAILISDPLLLLAGGFLYRQFRLTMVSLPVATNRREEFRELYRPWVSSFRGKGYTWLAYVLCVLIGIGAWTVNVVQTLTPLTTYEHDVFDSWAHPAGFFAFKFALFVSWVIIYPAIGYLFIYAAIATRVVLSEANQNKILNPYVEHPDGCYGFQCVGNLNLAILLPYLIAMFTLLAVYETHDAYYASIIFPAIIIVLLFLFISYAVIWPAQSILCQARASSYKKVLAASKRPLSPGRPEVYNLLAERFHYSTSNASPYSQSARAAVGTMRLAPIVTLGWKFIT
jgi:hypothetical protein